MTSTSGATAQEVYYNQIILEGVADYSTYALWTTGDIDGTEYMDSEDYTDYDPDGVYDYTAYGTLHDYGSSGGDWDGE